MMRDFSKEEFDIIIQAGQSNSQGSGMGNATNPFIENENVLFFNNDFTISLAQEKVNGNQIVSDFSLSFCREYMSKGLLGEGRKLLVIRSAVGGTGFLDNRWKPQDDLFLRMMEMTKAALALNPKNRLIAFLWHQGETDAILNATQEVHYTNLSTLLKLVRNTYHQTLPFVAGDFVSEWKKANISICEPVIEAIKKVCIDFPHTFFVATDGLEWNDKSIGNGDTIHFNREATYELGVRYFNAFEKIQNSIGI